MANRLDVTRQSLPHGRKTLSRWRLWRVLTVLISVPLLYILWVSKVEPSMYGTVVEQGSGKPVPNAKVLVTWYGMITPELSFSESSRPSCYRTEVVATDRNGRFEVPAWWAFAPRGPIQRVSSYNMKVGVYHPAYHAWRDEVEEVPAQIAVQPFSGNADDRFAELWPLSNVAACFHAPQQAVAVFLEAMLRELEQLRVSDPEMKAGTLALLKDQMLRNSVRIRTTQ